MRFQHGIIVRQQWGLALSSEIGRGVGAVEVGGSGEVPGGQGGGIQGVVGQPRLCLLFVEIVRTVESERGGLTQIWGLESPPANKTIQFLQLLC